MKKQLLIWLFSVTALTAAGQSNRLSRLLHDADEYFEYEKYVTATALYEEANELAPDDPVISYKLADCYRLTFHYEEAELYYSKTTLLEDDGEPLGYFYLGLMQKFNGSYEESIRSFDRFLDITDGTKRYPEYTEQAFIEQAGARNALEESANAPYLAEILPSPLNSGYNDFASANIPGGIILTSGRATGRKRVDERYGEAFTDLFLFRKSESGWTDQTHDEIRNLNDKFNDGSGSFSQDLTKFYYTVCGQERTECMVYVSLLHEDKWSDPVALNNNINYPGYDAKQPVISMTGDSLFFVSDRPGGFGGNDIWMSISNDGDDWGPAVNLGPSVNTRLNEVSPRTTSLPNILVFASNGHQGYGGYDLFMARRLSSGDTSLINIGVPFNSSRDELYPELFGDAFYWSSNRPEGVGEFDIYWSETGPALKFLSRLSLLNRSAKRSDVDLNSRKPAGRNEDLFTLVMEDKLEYDQLSRDEQRLIDRIVRGEAVESELGMLPAGKKNALLSLAARRRQLLENAKRQLATGSLEVIDGTEAYDIGGRIVASDGAVLSDIRLYLKNEKEEILMISGVSENGNFKYSHIPPGTDFHITADPFIYEMIDQLAVDGLEITPISSPVSNAENIYFDLDKFAIRPEASEYLNFLADQLINNPGAQIEIFAFADNSGSVAYNLDLTKKRGEAVFDFLVEKGVQGNQLMIKPQGQEFPASIDQSRLGRQQSRRVEFVLHGMTTFENDGAITCFANDSFDLSELMKQSGVEEGILMELNGFNTRNIRLCQPIRIPDNSKESIGKVLTCPKQ